MQFRDDNFRETAAKEEAARTNILGMSPWKWRLVRVFEAFARFFLPLLPSPHRTEIGRVHPEKILVLEYWGLGDVAVLVPFLRNLRQSFPKARISLLVNAALPCFLEGQGIVDEFIPVRLPWAQHFHRWKKYNPFSQDWFSSVRTLLSLRRRRFDWAFSGRMDVRDNLLLWMSGARRRIGYGVGGGGFFLTDRVVPDLLRPHRADGWLHLLGTVNTIPDAKLNYLCLADADRRHADSFLSAQCIQRGAVLIGVHPGARGTTRRWGHERFAEVARRVLLEKDAHVLWFSEPGDAAQAPKLDRCHLVSLDFRHFLAVLSRCKVLVCNDSGPMHLANLLRVPVVAVFGPQRPDVFGPRGAQDRVVIRPEFLCRPCFDDCIFSTPYCLRTISTEEVCREVRDALRQMTSPHSRQKGSAHESITAVGEPTNRCGASLQR